LVLLLLAGPFVQSQFCLGQFFFQIVDESSVMLLLILKPFSVLFLPLARVKTRYTNRLVGCGGPNGK
jgi:hypothetical protein